MSQQDNPVVYKKELDPKYSINNYIIGFGVDIALGIILGIMVDVSVTYITKHVGLGKVSKFLLQVMFNILVLFFIASNSDMLHAFWKGPGFGIVFMVVFISCQRNIFEFFYYIRDKEGEWGKEI
jgi:hypothetical protein